MIFVPSCVVCGDSETSVVWRSAAATPAFFSAATTACSASAFADSAAVAVAPRVSTVNWNEARSGTATTEPLPVTVIVRGTGVVSALWARRGCATPAIAAASEQQAGDEEGTTESVHATYTAPGAPIVTCATRRPSRGRRGTASSPAGSAGRRA